MDIRKGTAIAVSDGSYVKELGLGTAAWIIESEDGSQYIRGTCISPGPRTIQSAYRSEAIGLLAIIDYLHTLCDQQNLKEGKCTIACDGITAL